MRLATFNLLSGRSLVDGRADPARLVEAAAALDADVVALQEVDVAQPRSGSVDQVALVGDAVGARYRRFQATVRGTPGDRREWAETQGWDGAGPAYGVGLVSRLPVESWRVLRFGATRGRFPIMIPSRPRPRVIWIHDEPRVAVAAVLTSPRMTVVSTHLTFVPGPNVGQLRRLVRWMADLPGPRVLMGDVNLPGRLPARITGWESLVVAPTFPSPRPRLQLDHVLADGFTAADVRQVQVLHLPVSDHRAVVVEVTDASDGR